MCSAKKVFLEILQNSQENTCAVVSFFNKDLRPATFLKKRLWHRYFPVNFAIFLRTHFLTEHLPWLLLKFMLFEVLFGLNVNGTSRKHEGGCSKITSRIVGGWVSVVFVMLRYGKQGSWVVLDHGKKNRKVFFCTIVMRLGFH